MSITPNQLSLFGAIQLHPCRDRDRKSGLHHFGTLVLQINNHVTDSRCPAGSYHPSDGCFSCWGMPVKLCTQPWAD